ncbi:hypothetical protein QVZ43_02430 [Marinobacter sp. chi1]|uniref:Uncharacterized protein n=1 Tax=Marinobacter suaedae TaxID=3057675 RepID=A0ABT8VX38_9GAMM|nr:hypothetical protein [Marinobacter sp. chi1]MDO3720560.1 hypothetical protein [Marinobacter sp. chi1]
MLNTKRKLLVSALTITSLLMALPSSAADHREAPPIIWMSVETSTVRIMTSLAGPGSNISFNGNPFVVAGQPLVSCSPVLTDRHGNELVQLESRSRIEPTTYSDRARFSEVILATSPYKGVNKTTVLYSTGEGFKPMYPDVDVGPDGQVALMYKLACEGSSGQGTAFSTTLVKRDANPDNAASREIIRLFIHRRNDLLL